MIYTISSSTPIASIQSALSTEELITTQYYQDTNNLIALTTMSNKIIRFLIDGGLKIYIGDEWISDTTITNSIQVQDCYRGRSITGGSVIITPDIMAFVTIDAFPNTHTCIFGKWNNDVKDWGVMAFNTESSTYIQRVMNTVTGINYVPIGCGSSLKSANGYYYLTPLMLKDITTNKLLSFTDMIGVKYLLKTPITTACYTIYGNDVVVNAPYCFSWCIPTYINGSFIITNGNI